MASVFKRPNSPYWYAKYYAGKSTPTVVSTKMTDKVEAKKEATRLEVQARESYDVGMSKRMLLILKQAAQDAASKKLDLPAAERYIHQLYSLETGQEICDHPVTEAIEIYLNGKRDRIKEASVSIYEGYRDLLVKETGLMKKKARLFSRDDAEFCQQALKKNHSSSTVNAVMAFLRSVFRNEMENGRRTGNPVQVEPLPVDDKLPRGSFTQDEIERLLQKSRGEMRRAIKVAACTGLRKSDVLSLSWHNVDGDWLVVKPRKQGRGKQKVLRIPIVDRIAFVKSLRGNLLPNLKDYPEYKFAREFNRVMKKAKVPKRTIQHGQEVSRSFHSLRHSFVTALAEAGVPSDVRKALVGHSTAVAHENYNHPEKALKDALAAIS